MSIKIQIDKEEIILTGATAEKFIIDLEIENQAEVDRVADKAAAKAQLLAQLGITEEQAKLLLS